MRNVLKQPVHATHRRRSIYAPGNLIRAGTIVARHLEEQNSIFINLRPHALHGDTMYIAKCNLHKTVIYTRLKINVTLNSTISIL